MSNKRVREMADGEIRALVAPECRGHQTDHGPHTRPGRSYCIGPCTDAVMNARYADAKTCECRALIEEIDSGDGYRYWAHVKRMRIAYDHAAVPMKPESVSH